MTEALESLIDEIEALEVPDLTKLAEAIKALIEDRKEYPEVKVGDLVETEIRKGVTARGTVIEATKKRCKVKAGEIEGEFTVSTESVEVVFSAPEQDPLGDTSDE
jgi:DNA replicative helicase MCM subunit Mcm2 (Cdc46/Mcm family)